MSTLLAKNEKQPTLFLINHPKATTSPFSKRWLRWMDGLLLWLSYRDGRNFKDTKHSSTPLDFMPEKSQLPLGEKPDYAKKDKRTSIIWDSFCHSWWCLIHRHNVSFGIGAAIVTALKKCFSWFAYVSSTCSGKQWKWVKAPALEGRKENSFPQFYSKNINRAHFFFLHNVFLTFTSLLCVHLCVYLGSTPVCHLNLISIIHGCLPGVI